MGAEKLYGYTLSTPYHFEVKKVEDLHLDVIHVQQEFSVGIFGRILGHNLHIPVVYTYHTLYEDYTHYVNFFDLSNVEKISKKGGLFAFPLSVQFGFRHHRAQ